MIQAFLEALVDPHREENSLLHKRRELLVTEGRKKAIFKDQNWLGMPEIKRSMCQVNLYIINFKVAFPYKKQRSFYTCSFLCLFFMLSKRNRALFSDPGPDLPLGVF